MRSKYLSTTVSALVLVTGGVFALSLAAPSAQAQNLTSGLPYDAQRGVFTFASGLEQSLPAVVKVTTLGSERTTSENGPKPLQGGSGVIIDAANGIVVTNHHVIEGGRNFTVDLIDGRLFDATLIGSDKATDIAVLQIRGSGLSQVQTVDSDTLRSGDLAFAVGYPLGLDQTLTMGVVSGLNRSGLGDAIEDYIQTDAAVNSGNSGGPLLDSRGRLIGINTSILSGGFGGGNDGIAFAVPTRIMHFVVNQLRANGEVRRGQIGLTVGSLTAPRARELGLSLVRGAVIHDVTPGSSADRAGLRRGDVIVALEGRPVANGGSVQAAVGVATPGSSMSVSYLRGGREMNTTVVVEVEGADTPRVGREQVIVRGLTVRHTSEGVQIVVVESGSLAAGTTLKAGDIVQAVGGHQTRDLQAFTAALANAGAVEITVVRNGERKTVQLAG